MARWKALENEVQEVFSTSQSLDAAHLAQLRGSLVAGLHIGIAAGLDASEKTLTGCASFRTGTPVPGGAEGALVAIGAMFRLEADSAQGRYRITVRSKHIKASQAIRDLFKSLLA